MWDIWSVGDYRFLAEVLNSVGAWAGTGSPARIASIGMLLSFMVLGIQGLMQGGRMPQFQNILLGWIFYAFLFGPGVTVVVKDSYSLHTEVVDNVPLGLAATGSVLSNLTYAMTDEMKQAFSLPTMVDDIFGGALKILADSRELTFPTKEGQINRSVINYMKDCTNVGIARGELTSPDILSNSASPMEAIRWDSDIYTTQIFLPGDGTNAPAVSCNAAYHDLSAYFNQSSFWIDWDLFLENRYETSSASDKVQSVLNAMTTSGASAKNFMLSSAFYNLFKQAQIEGAASIADPLVAAAITEALAGRDAQAAADAQLFKRIARPGMAFFEATTYTVAPFMAFLVVLVPLGLSLIQKYFMLNIWVQLWMPSMAVLNFMGNFIMQDKIAAITNKGPVTSMMGAQDIFFAAQDWMSTVNTLAAMVPLFTMFLASGSMMIGSAMAQRMSGSDHYDEKKMSPDVMKNNPALTNNIGSYDATLTGSTQQGAQKVEWNVAQVMGSSVQSVSTELRQKNAEMYSGLSQSLGQNSTFQENLNNESVFHQSAHSATLHSSAFVQQKAAQIDKSLNAGGQLTDALTTSLSMDIGAQISKGSKGGKHAGLTHIGGSATQNLMANWSEQSGTNVNVADSELFQLSDMEQRSFSQAVAQDLSASKTTAFMAGTVLQEGEQAGTKAAEVLSASEAYTKATTLQSNLSQIASANSMDAGAYATQKGMTGEIGDMVQKHNLGMQSQNLAAMYQQQHGGTREVNHNRAAFHALYNASMSSPEARMDLMRLTGKAYNVDVAKLDGDPQSNDGISRATKSMQIPTQVDQQKTNDLLDKKQTLSKPPVMGTVTDNVSGTYNGRMGQGYEAVATAQRTVLNNAINEQSPARTAQETLAKAYNTAAGIQLGYELLAASAGGAVGGSINAAMESYKQRSAAFLSSMEEKPDVGLMDRFIASAREVFGGQVQSVKNTFDGALDGAAIQAQRLQNEYMADYKKDGFENGMSNEAVDYYAAKRYNEVAGGAALSVLGSLGEAIRPEAVDVSRYKGLDVDVRSGIDAGVETRNDAFLHMAGQLQDTLSKVDSVAVATHQQPAVQTTAMPQGHPTPALMSEPLAQLQQPTVQPTAMPQSPSASALVSEPVTQLQQTVIQVPAGEPISFLPQGPPAKTIVHNMSQQDGISDAKSKKLEKLKKTGSID